MRRINLPDEEVIPYNLRDGGMAVSIFADTQAARVDKARKIISGILATQVGRRGIVEPGCSAGDISGFFSDEHEVMGFDVVPHAVELAKQRYPKMSVFQAPVEAVKPIPCDILVLCEFLEHVLDPVALVKDWLPLARFVVIGHPLVRDGVDGEAGHTFAYDDDDFQGWFQLGGHKLQQAWTFPMGYEMIIGWGRRE